MTDLIKTVRGLDQNGPGENGENLEILWNNLTTTSNDKFHAAEESALRWLLKSMNGASPSAEALRRYPLTWTILDCVFQRVPLFSLAKSLADRRFVVILQQTLKDISKPTSTSDASTSGTKRKRSPISAFSLKDLQTADGCLATSQVLFQTLKSLFKLLDNDRTGSRDKIGAEHIRSLFCVSATEATTIASLSLKICDLLLKSQTCDDVEGREEWIAVISTIWGFHLQGDDDTLEVATHLFGPASNVLSAIENLAEVQQKDVDKALANRWSSDLQDFMNKNLILPARTAYLTRKSFDSIDTCLNVTSERINTAAPALYFLASSFANSIERDLRKSNAEWMGRIFQAIEKMIRERPDRNNLMARILSQAVRRSVVVDVDDLRSVCRHYGLQAESTDWSLISNAALCNPDIFHTSEEGTALLDEICAKIISEGASEDTYKPVSDLIESIQKGFRTRRDFSGFLRLWFTQLCEVERQQLVSKSPWFDMGRGEGDNESLFALVETELSPQQVLGVIEWVEGKELLSHPSALCLFSNILAQGIRTSPYIGIVGLRLFNLVSQVSDSSRVTALKWRVVSRTISWVSETERATIWASVKDDLSSRMKKSSIQSPETFEALKCCHLTWDSMSPDDKLLSEPAKLVEKFTARLAKEITGDDIIDSTTLPACVNFDYEQDFDKELALQQYLAWYLLGSSRLCRLYSEKNGELPAPLQNAMYAGNASPSGLRALWDALLCNDINVNNVKLAKNLLDRVISSLKESGKEKAWPGEQGQTWIRILSNVPIEAFSRWQREQVMLILDKRRPKMSKHPKKVSLESWTLFLDLATKMMGRPTFHEGMSFSNLVDIADSMSNLDFETTSVGDESLLELVGRFCAMASATIRQMSENIEERSIVYFNEAATFISECEAVAKKRDQEDCPRIEPFRVTLLKSLATGLGQVSNNQDHSELVSLLQSVQTALAENIMVVIGNFVADKKLLSKRDAVTNLSLFAAVDAAHAATKDIVKCSSPKSSAIQKLEKRTKEAMLKGDLKAWKLQIFLHSHFAAVLEAPTPTRFDELSCLASKSRIPVLSELVVSIILEMDTSSIAHYLGTLIGEYVGGHDTDGQILAIQHVVGQLLGMMNP